jgi:hypothetical protein
MLPGAMQQQRWQENSNANRSQFNQQSSKHSKQQHSTSSSTLSSSKGANKKSASSSKLTELPETFGLPSNSISSLTNKANSTSTSNLPKYNLSASSVPFPSSGSSSSTTMASVRSEAADKKSNTEVSKSIEIVIDENEPNGSSAVSSKLSTQVSAKSETKRDQQPSSPVLSSEVEIISENYNKQLQQTSQHQMQMQAALQLNNDESFRNYLAKTYSNVQLSIATKPQSNFISNLACINQLIKERNYYDTLKRRKPYSTLKLRELNRTIADDDDDQEQSDDDECEKIEDSGDDGAVVCKKKSYKNCLKDKQIIVIDDTNEEIHKPWITPELIKLIKHRNLLQSKINETSNKNAALNINKSAADAELMKKFKNLRNKVTKLVKKARKEYLAKYIQESKETKSEASNIAMDEKKTTENPNQTKAITSASAVSGELATASSQQTTAVASSKSPNSNTPASNEVNSITSQLNTSLTSQSFLKNQHQVMMNLYNTYFNQYMQQYTQQQQQMAAAAASSSKGKSADGSTAKASTETNENYEMLKQQATYYAQQQHAIQQQLEASLAQSAQQLMQEISGMAAAKVNQPFVFNQYTHQQQQHLHQHHHHTAPQQQQTSSAQIHSLPGPQIPTPIGRHQMMNSSMHSMLSTPNMYIY